MIFYQYSRVWPDRICYRNLLSQRRRGRKVRLIEDIIFAKAHHTSARNQDVKTPTQADFTVMRQSTTTVWSRLNYYK